MEQGWGVSETEGWRKRVEMRDGARVWKGGMEQGWRESGKKGWSRDGGREWKEGME
jgi:hypothetical protein